MFNKVGGSHSNLLSTFIWWKLSEDESLIHHHPLHLNMQPRFLHFTALYSPHQPVYHRLPIACLLLTCVIDFILSSPVVSKQSHRAQTEMMIISKTKIAPVYSGRPISSLSFCLPPRLPLCTTGGTSPSCCQQLDGNVDTSLKSMHGHSLCFSCPKLTIPNHEYAFPVFAPN